MQINFLTVLISIIVSVGIVSLVTGQIQWGILVGLLVGVGSAKWLRLKKQEAKDEIEYDERVNINIMQYSLQTFSISNLLLLVYLLISDQILNEQSVNVSHLTIYLIITLIVAFYVVPFIARKR
ncbi:hypothetical protein P8864_21665 [Priestia flexa]|uniref:hypothetical protein n=1 Tax=Priestia flexa TaxID=86664 RepID=UPI000C23450B|nr:hypothetical protein [Priestia flexa]MEC0668452.1 hypothetical protein [Priestia flexa]MED3824708.1 hypothetical protein [Priestia flexa]